MLPRLARARSVRPSVFPAVAVLVLAAAGRAQDVERITHLGENSPGTVSVTHVGSVYELTFTGDEVIRYQIDTADPVVAGGMVKVREVSSDCWPLVEAGPGYREASGGTLGPLWLSLNATALTGQSMTSNSVTLRYTDTIPGAGNPVLHRQHTFTLVGKTLRVRIHDEDLRRTYLRNYCGVTVGPTASTEAPKYVLMQGALMLPVAQFRDGAERWYCGLMLDMFQSNAADWALYVQGHLGDASTSFKYNYDTYETYWRQSDGSISGPLDDTIVVTISSKLKDTLGTPAGPRSPYLPLLDHRTMVLLPGWNWGDYRQLWSLFEQWGMFDIAGYCFLDWTDPARDDPPMTQNAGPDWWPARDPHNFRRMAVEARDKGFLLGVYTAFNQLPPTSPLHASSLNDRAMNDSGVPFLSVQSGFDALAISACLRHVRRESQLLRRDYGLNMGYLDIQTYASPSHGADGCHMDQRATAPWAANLRDAISDQKRWMKEMQETFEGPICGEASISTASASMEWLWSGHCESVQRVINTNSGSQANVIAAGNPNAPTNYPVIPEFELHVMSRLQRNHGNGFPDRFFGPSDGPGIVQPNGEVFTPMTEAAMDRYRAYEISHGKMSFLTVNGPYNGIGNWHTFGDMLKEYYLVSHLQSLYYEAAPTTIRYEIGGVLQTFEQIFAPAGDLNLFRHPRLHVAWPSGLELWVNHGTTSWTVTTGGVTYAIPEDGFVARKPGATAPETFLAFSAIPAGVPSRIDYCYAPSRWEFFDGRGLVNGYGGIVTGGINRVRVNNFVLGRIVRETAVGNIEVLPGTPPSVASVAVVPSASMLGIGQRAGFRAIATYSNGATRNVTKLVSWSSSSPVVARVNQGAAVTAVGPGTASIQCTPYVGVPVTPATVTVP